MVAAKIPQRHLALVPLTPVTDIGDDKKDYPEQPRYQLESLNEFWDGFGQDTVSLINKRLPLEDRIRR